MKSVFFLLSIAFFVTSNAQTDSTKIYNSKQLKKGFYKTYEEFINNNPSLTGDFTVKEKTNKTDSTVVEASYKISQSSTRDYVWGFCDGNSVYVCYETLTTKEFWKLQSVGPVAFLELSYKTDLPVPIPISRPVYPVLHIRTGERYVLMVVNQKGKLKVPDHAYMKKLLSSQPDLKQSFEDDWEPFVKYDYATDDPEPDESLAAKRQLIKFYLDKLNDRIK